MHRLKFWGTEKPDLCIEKSLYRANVAVRRHVRLDGKVGPTSSNSKRIETISNQ